MTSFSYHASHEQFAPSELLALVRHAETAGFDAVFCSDHAQPWAPAQGHAGHTWSWLGAALQGTRHMPFGTITVPGAWRYHPVVLAQAIGTLGQMYPHRLPWLAFGSGEAVNEQLVGAGWPAKDERQRRLKEGVDIVRALLAGERVTYRGLVMAEDARVWDRPVRAPLLFGAATTEATAEWLGSWADGLLTLGRDLAQLQRMMAAFRQGGGQGKPVHVKVDVSWAPDLDEALHGAHAQWRFNCLGGEANAGLRQPEDFEQASRFVRPHDMHQHVLVAKDAQPYIDHFKACAQLGVTAIDIHQVSLSQRTFITYFGEAVLPALRA